MNTASLNVTENSQDMYILIHFENGEQDWNRWCDTPSNLTKKLNYYRDLDNGIERIEIISEQDAYVFRYTVGEISLRELQYYLNNN